MIVRITELLTEKVDAEYSALDNIPETVVSLRAAVRVQGTGDESQSLKL